jgi:signal transduction histidine kinase
MKRLTARDALSDHPVHVTAEMHPPPNGPATNREAVYVVFEEPHDGSPAQSFLGIVDGRRAILFPYRIFADLVRPWQLAYVGPDTPLEIVQERLLNGMVYSIPVVDDSGAFLGAVSRDSVLKTLVARQEEMFSALKQGLDLLEQQRNLIAFEIHDGLVQYATAAHMHLQSAAKYLATRSPEASAQIAHGTALLQEVIDEARCLIRGLHLPMLEGADLVGAIESLVQQQRTSRNEEIEFVSDGASLHLSPFQQTAVFRIIQEALTNALRHSGSRRIHVGLSRQADHVRIDVRDWGCGFDRHALHSGYGLKGIRYYPGMKEPHNSWLEAYRTEGWRK